MFPIETTTLRPRPWPAYLIFFLGIAMFLIPQKNGEKMALYVGAGLLVFAVIMWFFISKSGIAIDNSGLTYKTVFKTKEILWERLSKTYIKYERHGKSGSHYWFFVNAMGGKVKFSINLYSRKSLRTIAEAVTMKCKDADIDQKIYNMAEGLFPWYIF